MASYNTLGIQYSDPNLVSSDVSSLPAGVSSVIDVFDRILSSIKGAVVGATNPNAVYVPVTQQQTAGSSALLFLVLLAVGVYLIVRK